MVEASALPHVPVAPVALAPKASEEAVAGFELFDALFDVALGSTQPELATSGVGLTFAVWLYVLADAN